MDHIKILKRAFHITLDYRVLWVFGILLALTSGANLRSSGNASGGGGSTGGNGGTFTPPGPFPSPHIPAEVANTIIAFAIALACLILIMIIVGAIARYVSEAALIRMVNEYEDSGEKVGVRQGFRLGWSRSAFRIFLVDLLLGMVGIVVFLLLMLIAAAPLLLWLTESQPLEIIGTVAAIGLFFLIILLAIVVAIILSLVLEFVRRSVVLEGSGVVDGLRRGFALLRMRLGDIIIMGLILFGLGLVWTLVMIPVFIGLFLAAVILGGLPALLVGWIVSLFAEGALPWIAGALVALPIFFLVVAVPLAFLSGLVQVFKSSTWTLTFREVLALEAVKPREELEGPDNLDEDDGEMPI